MKDNADKISQRDGTHSSLWQSTGVKISHSNNAANDALYDTLIIGGGITGITTALLLQKQGQNCIIAEAHTLGFGTTGGTTAHLNTFLDATYPEIDSDFGKEASAQMAKASKDMISFIQKNIEELSIDADFKYLDAYLFSQNEKETKELRSILNAAQEAGVAVTEAAENGTSISFDYSLRFSNQAQFHPLKYIRGLARAFENIGGRILENTFIHNIEFKNEIHHAKYGEKIIRAKNVVYATHVPPGVNILSLRNAPYRSYVLAVTLKDDHYPDCLIYDMQEPYHYLRTHEINGKKYLIIGGADHKTGHDDPIQAFDTLEQYAKTHFQINAVDYRWSSQYYVPVDGLPYVGQLPGGAERTFVATGFNGNGMILGSLSATIISDLIFGKENQYAKLLSPSRLKPLAGFNEFIKENADVAYHFLADRIGTAHIKDITDLNSGEGKVVEYNGEKLAVYKDDKGKVTALSPVCTHAGCIVNWNPEEKSWDCPCHGGRFSTSGTVITGPPRKNLEEIPIKHL
ncbi:FAD-dependent oxidoreductase [Pedobacter chinensis]|uniref:FAD-dependent oxidoreductase n=1 Tax=Pedobacter chinensis TaxID=2282421 RepID=A0A369Q1D3_9SPHI|nr:FAD-dependent oxidoreductase [Pedobacter chinensis]RDC56148.1 FAD-dependent oxidoreductase [Pedobacter chinensis]